MTATREFTVALFTLLMSAAHCGSAELDPPSNVTYSWIDPLTVNVSWTWHRPKDLPEDCEIKFTCKQGEKNPLRTSNTQFQDNLFSEESDTWKYSIRARSECNDKESNPATIVIKNPMPKAKLEDFKCYMSDSSINLSWIANPSSPMSLSYRQCETTPEPLEKCDPVNSTGRTTECQMKGQFLQKDLCMVAETASERITFKPKCVASSPEMNIIEDDSSLILTPTRLELTTSCWHYNICYSACSEPFLCKEYSMQQNYRIPYDKSCLYELRYRARTNIFSCTDIRTDWSETITYSSKDWTLTVVAIVIPIIVSVCVILSCYCFRRHKDIICPDIPDPSTIFKEMINGNKEQKTKMPMYVPVQEPTERITVVSNIPQNSCV